VCLHLRVAGRGRARVEEATAGRLRSIMCGPCNSITYVLSATLLSNRKLNVSPCYFDSNFICLFINESSCSDCVMEEAKPEIPFDTVRVPQRS
jgi:hypothetical protein